MNWHIQMIYEDQKVIELVSKNPNRQNNMPNALDRNNPIQNQTKPNKTVYQLNITVKKISTVNQNTICQKNMLTTTIRIAHLNNQRLHNRTTREKNYPVKKL